MGIKVEWCTVSNQQLQKKRREKRKDHKSQLPAETSMATKLTTSFLSKPPCTCHKHKEARPPYSSLVPSGLGWQRLCWFNPL